MTIELHAIQRIRAFSESTFGADSSGSIAGSYTDLPIVEGSATMAVPRDELDPGQLVQHRVEGRERVLGKKSATLTFQMNLAPSGTPGTNGVSSITGPLGMLLKAVMGGEQLAEGSIAAAGSTATVVNVSAGDGAHWQYGGQVMGWANAAGIVEWREVKSRSTDAITLKRGFSGAPATSDVLYNKATYYFTANPAESLAFFVEGLENEDRWLLVGGQAVGGFTIALDMTAGTIPRVTFNMTFASWYKAGDTSTPITGTLGTATYSATNPIVGEAGRFESWTVGSPTFATTQAIHISALAFEPHVSFVPYTSPTGVNTIKQWVAARNPDSPVQGQFTTVYQDTTWWTHRDSKTDVAFQYVAGVTGADSFIISAPTTQVLNPQRAPDASGLAGQIVMWKGRRDTDTAQTTDIAKSPLRIHL